MLYDISPAISPELAVWPGDEPFSGEFQYALEAGAAANVGVIRTTLHLGSHVDAPLHTEAGAAGIGDLPLEAFLGPCRVLAVPPVPLLEPEHLGSLGPAPPPRLLLRTGSVADRHRFSPQFSALSPRLAAWLAGQGPLLVGLDTPSVDPYGSEELPAHHALAGAGVVILEGLVLDAVPPGDYELIALPLKLAGLDASPVRAVLRG
ncbi:MAG TPA: arylformamidase [Thermoanaerobaculia bacterium]|nr:arylformamidase [Thermoanaerobaculia bacterium]